MIKKLEAYLEAHPKPKWVHLDRKISGIELLMEGSAGVALFVMILMVLVCILQDIIFFRAIERTSEHRLLIIITNVVTQLVYLWIILYSWKFFTQKTVLRIGDQSDQFSLARRLGSGEEQSPMSFDRRAFIAEMRRVHRGKSTIDRLEIYPDEEARGQGLKFWTQDPKGPCFLIENWNKKRCQWLLGLLMSLKEGGSQAGDLR